MKERSRAVALVAQLRDPVVKHLLARYCISTKWNYQVRTVDPEAVAAGAALHDEQIDGLLASCLGLDIEGCNADSAVRWALRQAKLPFRHGGFGNVPALHVRYAAYYGSYVLVAPHIFELFADVGCLFSSESSVTFGAETTSASLEARLLQRVEDFDSRRPHLLPKSYGFRSSRL